MADDNVIQMRPKAEARGHNDIVKELVAARYYSRQILSWAIDPSLKGTIPNDGLMAGVLVELCHRLDALENPKR